MNKKPVLIIVATLVITLIIFFAIINNNKVNDKKFSALLNECEYDKAYQVYRKHISEYEQSFNKYLMKITDDYNNSIITHKNALSILSELLNNGFPENNINAQIKIINNLLISKNAYLSGYSLFCDYDILEAKEQFFQVIEKDYFYRDAQNKISSINKLVEENENSYIKADSLYAENSLEAAYEIYKKILNSKINIDRALEQITKIENINSAWDEEFSGEKHTKCTYPYEAAVKDDFLYIPFSHNGTHTIIKYNIKTQNTEIIAIARMSGAFLIKDINTVGQYLYFIAGENTGSGKMLTNPYNIYRMKNDGTELECVAYGDYDKLIAYKDGFYASTYSQGIIKLDKNLKIIEQISKDRPIQMLLVNDKLYFTLHVESSYYSLVYAEYQYDGNNISEIRRHPNLRFAFFSDTEYYSYRIGSNYYERVYKSKNTNELNEMIAYSNFIGIYGLLGDDIICAKERLNGTVDYYLLNTEDYTLTRCETPVLKDTIHLEKVCYENQTLFFLTPDGLVITDKKYDQIDSICLSDVDFENLELNNSFNFLHESEYYTDDEIVIKEDNFWYYSSPQYNIRIERVYNEDFNTSIYIAHIRTTEANFLSIDSPGNDTYTTRIRKYPADLARQYSAVFACSGDFFEQNYWTGISIRNGIVYKNILQRDMMAVYPDGYLKCYTSDDGITAEDMLSAEVKNTLSFGPILLSNQQYGNSLYEDRLCAKNPRNSIGMIEQGHYVVILCDGRDPVNSGLTFRSLTDIHYAEGCVEAYNLDGGLSSIMIFMGECINEHFIDEYGKSFRALPEIIYFGTSDLVPDEN